MKKYNLSGEDLVANCLIEINTMTNRRIIDMKDITFYQEAVYRRTFSQDIEINMNIDRFDIEQKLKNSKLIHFEDINNPKFIMLPYINSKDLTENYRDYIPLDPLVCMMNIKELSDLDIDIKRLQTLELIKLKYYKEYIENLETEIINLDTLKQKKLEKIKLSKENMSNYKIRIKE